MNTRSRYRELAGYVDAAIADLQAAQAADPWDADAESPHFHRSRVPTCVRQRLADAPVEVADALAMMVGSPSSRVEMIAAVDLLGVVATKERLVAIWREHGRRIAYWDAHDALVSALRDRGDEGLWIAETIAKQWEEERALASSPGLTREQMCELANTTSDAEALQIVFEREDVPVELLVAATRTDLALWVAAVRRLPVHLAVDLARGSDVLVAARAVEHPLMPTDVLAELAMHSKAAVRLAVAERGLYDGDVPASVLELLAHDPCEQVRFVIDKWHREQLMQN